MKPYYIVSNKSFVGREAEFKRLDEIRDRGKASLIVVYGRRRIGKTELIEQYFKNRRVLKFEGIELSSDDPRSGVEREKYQITQSLARLSKYLEDPILAKVDINSWTEFFELLDKTASKMQIVLYFEEIQWLADYQADFFSELKPFWDDHWRHNPKLTIVLCGSSTSFVMKQLLSDRALYGRVLDQFHLKPFNLLESKKFLGRVGNKEAMLAVLTVGGIPQYLSYLKGGGSVLANLCGHSFLPSSTLLYEKDRIFVSSMSHHKHYEDILDFLSRRKHATASQITHALRGKAKSGGSLTKLFDDLLNCNFIEKHTPIHKTDNSKLVRYTISDEFLSWYYTFIQPIRKEIEGGKFSKNPADAINKRALEINLGFNFERWCFKNEHLFARILGFSGVEYESGNYFNHKTEASEPGFQIDLMYVIKGSKVVICEIKYYDGLVGNSVCDQVKKKIELFRQSMPRYKNYTFEAVLITTEGVRDKKTIELTFDRVITLDDIFDERYW